MKNITEAKKSLCFRLSFSLVIFAVASCGDSKPDQTESQQKPDSTVPSSQDSSPDHQQLPSLATPDDEAPQDPSLPDESEPQDSDNINTIFASPSGAKSGDCTKSAPCDLEYAVKQKAQSGTTVSLNDGAYRIGQLVVPTGVSITSTAGNNTKVKISPNTNLGASTPLILMSSSKSGSNGKQSLSHLEIAGIEGSNRAESAILVKNRDNVSIHHCNIHDFTGNANWGISGSYALFVLSTQIPATNQWWNFWPEDVQAPGDDTNINSGKAGYPTSTNDRAKYAWPANPVRNFQFYNNKVINCGDQGLVTTLDGKAAAEQTVVPISSTTGFKAGMRCWIAAGGWQAQYVTIKSVTPGVSVTLTTELNAEYKAGHTFAASKISSAIGVFNLKDSSFHHNRIDGAKSESQAISGTSAFLDNVDIFNNHIAMSRYKWRTSYPIELWLLKGGCDIHDNVSNEGFSIAYGKETKVYNNKIVLNPPNTTYGIGIEFIGQSHGSVHGNFISGAWVYGIDSGSASNGKNFIIENVSIRNNVIHSPSMFGIGVFAEAGNTTRNFNVINNVIDGETATELNSTKARGGSAIDLRAKNKGTSHGILQNIVVSNNIVIDMSEPGVASGDGTFKDISIDNNLFYNSGTNRWRDGAQNYLISDSNTISSDPNFLREDLDFDGYVPQVPSPAIDKGIDVGLPYAGSAPDIGAIEVVSPAN